MVGAHPHGAGGGLVCRTSNAQLFWICWGLYVFMFVNLVLFTALAFWVFVNNMEDSVMDSFIMHKIAQYNQSEGIFNLVIDTVQRDLRCCGFKSSSDWSDRFPSSCCPENCTNEICVEVECALETVHTSS